MYIIINIILFILMYFSLFRKKPKKAKIILQETEKTQEIEKAPIDYYQNRLNILYEMLETAKREEQAEKERIERINELNQYGVVVNEKNQKRSEYNLYIARRKRLSIEKQIHITEKALKTGD